MARTTTIFTPRPTSMSPTQAALARAQVSAQRAQLGESRAGLELSRQQLAEREAGFGREQALAQELLGYIPGDIGAQFQDRGLSLSSLVAPTIRREESPFHKQLADILGQIGLLPQEEEVLGAREQALGAEENVLGRRLADIAYESQTPGQQFRNWKLSQGMPVQNYSYSDPSGSQTFSSYTSPRGFTSVDQARQALGF